MRAATYMFSDARFLQLKSFENLPYSYHSKGEDKSPHLCWINDSLLNKIDIFIVESIISNVPCWIQHFLHDHMSINTSILCNGKGWDTKGFPDNINTLTTEANNILLIKSEWINKHFFNIPQQNISLTGKQPYKLHKRNDCQTSCHLKTSDKNQEENLSGKVLRFYNFASFDNHSSNKILNGRVDATNIANFLQLNFTHIHNKSIIIMCKLKSEQRQILNHIIYQNNI